ncbi:pirin [Enterobacter cloacae]|uniref:Pirin n=1 Tax=Enterobacter cloacae TaxID=550 RepID=A0A377LR89_ENTCL|nr:pirin [Enterobacter cloacae]
MFVTRSTTRAKRKNCTCIKSGSFQRTGITPRYEQRRFDAKQGKQLVLSPDAREGSLKVHQDMELYRWGAGKDEQSVHQIAANRRVWIQVVKGEVSINGTKATTADGLAIWDEQALSCMPTAKVKFCCLICTGVINHK